MDSDQESEGRRDSDATSDESETGSSKSSEYSNSISSSMSGGSSDDYIQVDPKTIFTSVSSGVASSKSHSDAKRLSQSVTRHQLKESSKTSTSSTSQVSDVTHESEFSTISQSPSVQVMEREAGFDPNRIPSSIFGSKDSSYKEWSTASNESLFSIHTTGNGSPARDDILMTDGDFKRSRKRDSCVVDKNEKNNKSELTRYRQTLPITKGGEHKKTIFEKEKKADVVNKPPATGSSDEATKRIVRFREEMKLGENINRSTAIVCSDGNVCYRDSCSVVRPSDANDTYSAPPMKKKCSWWSCCSCSICPSCSLKCSGCSCKWLSCSGFSCKWLSCSGFSCKWLSGCSCKWLSCSSCSCKWPSCSSCSCKWPSCLSCSCKWPSCSSCSCKWLSCSSCSCKWPSCSSCSCKWLSCSSCSCKWPSSSSCSFKWPSCSSCSCKLLSCTGCHCKWPSMPVGCCKWPCSHGGCCKWPSCKCKCLTSLHCCC